MKRFLIVALALLAAVAALPGTSSAAGPFNFYVRWGVMTDQSFSFSPFLWTGGANFDFNLGPALVLSPECDVLVYKFHFNPLWLTPAVTLNFRAKMFFAGGGLAKFLVIGSGYTLTSDFLLKLNAGIKTDTFKLQAYILTPLSDEAFDDLLIGATIGMGF